MDAGAGQLPDTGQLPAPHGRPGAPAAARRRRLPRPRPALSAGLVAATLAGVLAGRVTAGWWAGTADALDVRGEVATAVVTDSLTSIGARGRTTLALTVHLTNRGTVPLELWGAGESYVAGEIVALEAGGLTIAPGGQVDTGVRAIVNCASPQPLRLPDLTMRRPDRTPVSVRVDGDGWALVRACEAQPSDPHVLELISAVPDGKLLRIQFRSPSGRTTQVVDVWAGSVRMATHPVPAVTDDSESRTFWLDPPASCPPEWVRGGLPRTIDLDVDVGAPGSLSLDTGFALPRWLRAGVCAKAAG